MLAAPLRAGEADYEADDTHENGAPYFGEAKEVGSMTPMPEVRVKAQVRGTMRFFTTETDEDGRFKRSGMGPDVDPDTVVVTCEKLGFRTVAVMRRRASSAKTAAVEVECLMEKAK